MKIVKLDLYRKYMTERSKLKEIILARYKFQNIIAIKELVTLIAILKAEEQDSASKDHHLSPCSDTQLNDPDLLKMIGRELDDETLIDMATAGDGDYRNQAIQYAISELLDRYDPLSGGLH